MRFGHTATILTTMDHTELVKSYGLPLVSVPIDVQSALQSSRVSASLEVAASSAPSASSRLADDAELALEAGPERSRGTHQSCVAQTRMPSASLQSQ